MALKFCLLLAGLALQALASSPVEPPRDSNAEDWSLLHFRRACAEDQSRCDYSFLISEYAAEAPKYCNFAIDARDGLPAYQVGFSLAKCPDAAEYSVNGGWSQLGFVTLTVINDNRNLESFFAFKDDILVNGTEAAPQKSAVYIHPIPGKRGLEPKDQHEGLALASEWKLADVVRYVVDQGTPTETIVVSFSIEGGGASSEYCFLQVPVSGAGGTSSKSFYNRDCDGSKDWTVSWGHNEVTDEAVMTLVNKNHGRRAFFGFNNVSTHVLLGPNGPNPTKEVPWGS